MLQNATIFNILDDGEINLVDGEWEGAPFEPGMARPHARLLDLTAAGDLDGDGTDETVALLVYSGGGTGQFLYVTAFSGGAGGAADLGTTEIGDRNMVRGLTIENGQILLDVVTQGPNDGACCPTQNARVTLTLGEGTLNIVSMEQQGTLSIADIEGEWALVTLNAEEPVLGDAPITATFAAGRISGSAGCNTYNALYKTTSADDPTELTFSPAATTRMACAGPAMTQEQVFLERLGAVTNFYWDAGQLSLTYALGELFGALTFERVNTP